MDFVERGILRVPFGSVTIGLWFVLGLRLVVHMN